MTYSDSAAADRPQCRCEHSGHFAAVRICTCVHTVDAGGRLSSQWCPIHAEWLHRYQDADVSTTITNDAGAQIQVCATCADHHRTATKPVGGEQR